MSFPLSIPYPLTTYTSHYGHPTSNDNFCELDFQFSPHIAELINTVSNVVYLLYALHGLRSLHTRQRLSFTTALPHIGLIAVGLGSALFHATLLKIPQLLDEIGMAIPTGAVVSRLLANEVRDPAKRNLAYVAALGTVAAVYALHCVVYSNWIHYPAFGLMVQVVARRCMALIRSIEDEAIRKKVRRQARQGEALFIGAFCLWLVDRFCCAELVKGRSWLGLPWGWVLELHAWWHLGTGMAAFVFIQMAEYLMEGQELGGKWRDPGERLDPWALKLWGWESKPDAMGVERKKATANGHSSTNGKAKGGRRKKN